ncbi:MAG TPA: hypothetical protein VFB55_01350 [Verrucomicrobiae bacterium]|nr:hypothetical protein [Verrucomicrobiae bacterium]
MISNGQIFSKIVLQQPATLKLLNNPVKYSTPAILPVWVIIFYPFEMWKKICRLLVSVCVTRFLAAAVAAHKQQSSIAKAGAAYFSPRHDDDENSITSGLFWMI